ADEVIARAAGVAERGRDLARDAVGAREIGGVEVAAGQRLGRQIARRLVVDVVDGELRAIEEAAAVVGARGAGGGDAADGDGEPGAGPQLPLRRPSAPASTWPRREGDAPSSPTARTA